MQYKRVSFEFSNTDVESQDAFELARQGAPRPQILGTPVIYNLEMKLFRLPKILLNIQIISETDYFLRSIFLLVIFKIFLGLLCTKLVAV